MVARVEEVRDNESSLCVWQEIGEDNCCYRRLSRCRAKRDENWV